MNYVPQSIEMNDRTRGDLIDQLFQAAEIRRICRSAGLMKLPLLPIFHTDGAYVDYSYSPSGDGLSVKVYGANNTKVRQLASEIMTYVRSVS